MRTSDSTPQQNHAPKLIGSQDDFPSPGGHFVAPSPREVPKSPVEIQNNRDAFEQKCKIFIKGLSEVTPDKELQANFMMFGDIKDMIRKYDWALILYDKPSAAEDAVKEMNGIYIDDV